MNNFETLDSTLEKNVRLHCNIFFIFLDVVSFRSDLELDILAIFWGPMASAPNMKCLACYQVTWFR